MRAGQLRHPIDIEKFTQTQDPNTGLITEEWAVIGQAWGSIVGISGREFIAAGAEQSETTYRVTMRYRPDLTTSMRLVSDGVTYGIRAVLPDNRRSTLTLMCEVL